MVRQNIIIERNKRRKIRVFNYLRNRLPWGEVNMELVSSLSEKEFNKFLFKARLTSVWNVIGIPTIAVGITTGISFIIAFFLHIKQHQDAGWFLSYIKLTAVMGTIAWASWVISFYSFKRCVKKQTRCTKKQTLGDIDTGPPYYGIGVIFFVIGFFTIIGFCLKFAVIISIFINSITAG